MASPQALGAALSYNPFLPADANAKLFALQRQMALAQALQTEGLTPLDTKDRQINGVGYAISPMEGYAKLAQALLGGLGQNQAAKNYGEIFSPNSSTASSASSGAPQMTGAAGQAGTNNGGGAFGLPPDIANLAAGMYGMEGGPRAVAELIGKFSAPTEQQKNFGPYMDQWRNLQLMTPGAKAAQEAQGTAYAGSLPYGAPPPGMGGAPDQMGTQPAIQPVQGPQSMPPVGGAMEAPPISASDLSQGPVQTNIPAPPSGIQLSGPNPNTISVTNPINGQQGMVSPLVDRQLEQAEINRQPQQAQNLFQQSQQGVQPPNLQGMSTDQAKAAMKAWEAKQSAKASEEGKTIGEAEKAANTIDSRYDNSIAILDEMARLAKKTSGGPSANLMEPVHRMLDDKTSAANKSFENLAANQLTTALAPIVQGVGGRIDIPLMRAIQEAESVDLTDSTQGKLAVINNLKNMLQVHKQNAHNMVNNTSGLPVVSQQSPFAQSPNTTYWIIQDGKLVKK